MESFIVEHAQFAHWIIFGLLMLAGLNFPISEDLLIIVGAVLASTIVPENIWKIFSAIYLGAYLSDLVAYWLGRWLGPSLGKWRLFRSLFQKEKIQKISKYYTKYGTCTLIFGRLVPFGLRNALFVSAGIGRMRFAKFAAIDGAACLMSNSLLFSLTYFCGRNYSYLLKSINVIIFIVFVIALICYLCYKKLRNVERI